MISTLQQHRIAYPEAAWIANCENEFPSRVSWVYKHLSKVDVLSESVIPKEVYSTTTSIVMKNRVTVGSGKTYVRYLSRKTSNTIIGKMLNKSLELDYVVVYTTIPFNCILNYFKILILNLYMIIYINNNFILQIGNRL